MPRLKLSDDELNIRELEDAEYTEDDFQPYEGKQPPAGTVLAGHVKKMWLTDTSKGDRMLVVLFVADGNTDDKAQYDGLPIWERLALIPTVKFRWKPFIDAMGFTLRDLKLKLYVSDEDENAGAPIEKIGTFVPGEDALCRVITKREKYGDEWNTKVKNFLEHVEPDDEEEEDEDLEDYEEQDEPEAEEDEEEEEPEPPAKPARRAAAKPARPAATAKPATRAAKPTPTKTATRGRKARGYSEEPPF